jgi:RHS repeat-associated protein
MDMVVGVDIHFEMVIIPPAPPVPTPFPNPFIGIVIDPAGLAIGLALGAALAVATGGTPTGPVIINSMFATNVGTEAKGMGHILIPPGSMWVPMPKFPKLSFRGPPEFPGPPIKPEDDAVSIMGSTTVSVMGSSAVRMGEMWMSCGEPLRLPSSVVIAIPKGPLVLIGGPPGVNLMDALLGMIKTKWVAGYMHSLISRIKSDRLRNILNKAACFLTGHPVDVATGRLLTDNIDFELPGPLPLKFERNYASSWSHRDGPLGPGWSHSLDQAVWSERGKLVYLAEDGREIEFDVFDFPDHMLQVGQEVYEPITQLTLRFKSRDLIEIEKHHGEILEFAPPKVRGSGPRAHWWRLQKRRSRDRHEILLSYDDRNNLQWVRDSGGRIVGFEHDGDNRLVRVLLPHPTQDQAFIDYVRYAYDAEGDLVRVTDALGASWTFAYKRHLMVRETNRNGLSFYFAYDGFGSEAYCVRTWGDGGIYDHVIDYAKGAMTVVTNSLGSRTTYKLNPIGQVVEVVDARGGTSKYEYDERSLRVIKETNPSGGERISEYDALGNLVKMTQPDGTQFQLEYDAHNEPRRAIDVLGGEWSWEHDAAGRPTQTVNAAGEFTRYSWTQAGLSELTDAAGLHTGLEYDASGNLIGLNYPGGQRNRWTYDRLGRCTARIDGKGNVWKFARDLLGRIVWCEEADGNTRELAHDAEGNLLVARDQHRHVRFDYAGVNRLVARAEGGQQIEFTYDTEEHLTEIRNEVGRSYHFELDAFGDVIREHGFDSLRRDYERDKSGRVVIVKRPADRSTAYDYDALGRVVGVTYHDGSRETYEYRGDGTLTAAANSSTRVTFERDAVGRLLRETQGDDWVASSYDALGRRTNVRSSKGFLQTIRRDAAGSAMAVDAELETSSDDQPLATKFAASFERDALGLELERNLPGGVRARWERDAIGRPVRHEIWRGSQFHTARQYTWDHDWRLRRVVDAMTGPIDLHRDNLGSLKAVTYADGSSDLRMPDAVGNLFRSPYRSDRRYGNAGEVLEARDANGSTHYQYDQEGNLIAKVLPDGATWNYSWNGAGLLASVRRPDGEVVEFEYDALARRMSKTFRGKTTRWIWDGHVPLHEWTVLAGDQIENIDEPTRPAQGGYQGETWLKAMLATRPAHGPPVGPLSERECLASASGTASDPVTWIFEPDGFAPLAKLVAGRAFSIVCDHLGTPFAMFDDNGNEVWQQELDAYGATRTEHGARNACPFRWPGQYEDVETGLYYNRFRYYSPEAGNYISQDPIGLMGSLGLAQYPLDPSKQCDPFGLTAAELGQAMADAGRPLAAGQTPHHIVKENAGGFAERSRQLLDRNGVDVNSSPNGAALWGTHPSQVAQPGHPGVASARATGNYHGGAHIHGKGNDKLIFRILSKAEKRGIPLDAVLEDIGRRMESGSWKETAEGGCH